MLSEFCEDEFTEKNSLDIIIDKVKKGKVIYSKANAYVEIMHFFKNKGIIDVNKDVDTTKKELFL